MGAVPAAVAFQQGCPDTIALNSEQFLVSTCIVDAFGTEVLGEMLQAGDFGVVLDVTSVQNCLLESDNSTQYSPVSDTTGLANFDVGLLGSNGTNCSLSFSEKQIFIKSAACSVYMEGCDGDDVDVVQGFVTDM